MTQTSAQNVTRWFDAAGWEVFPCRCGLTHDGDYGLYDHAHHNCFHDDPLVDIGGDEIPGYLMCPSCGKTFHVEFGGGKTDAHE